MKYHKILSITLTNGFALLIFGSILASCQKNAIQKNGYFTDFKINNRMPASEALTKFVEFQDPKQIFIYCQLNELKTQSCYHKNIKETLARFQQKHPGFNKMQIEGLTQELDYKIIQQSMQTLSENLLKGMSPKINEMVENRSKFCMKNSKFYMHRCLYQYLNKESMHVLNLYQSKNSKVNGHEYLYLKNIIEDKFKEKLELSYQQIQNSQKKTSLIQFRSILKKIKEDLLKDTSWLQKSPNVAVAKDKCLEKILHEAHNEIQDFDQEEIRQFIVENACIDIVGNNDILESINTYTQLDFENHLQNYEKSLVDLIKQSKCLELDNLMETRKCINSKWDGFLEASFTKWSKDNRSYQDQKKLFFMRVNNNASSIKRNIASESE